ncbi:hypothetical protein [Crassaminicella profunda]|uniref:hypothetical protein n=1 Tax=Crassaminicella profunda TaxID=1286698 RepID=UPI001CA66229|nr:hypothetical protein [Crassaminicella profunda]QZY53831.1 hypothetical protein K7H06_12280 [Crassaminicella profunda]
MKTFILEKIAHASLQEIFDINSFKDIDWIWVNEEIFRDIIYNLDLDKELDEEILDSILENLKNAEMINVLIKPFEKEGYIPIDQHLFANLEKEYKVTEDIETIIFIKEKYYTKLFIKGLNHYRWMLKAMAIDTYLKMGLEYKSLKETYKELYDENTRIIEDVLSKGEYEFSTGVWKFIQKTKELYFYKMGKFFNSWSEGEVDAKFEEMIKRT